MQQRSIIVLSPDADRCCQQDYVSCWQQGLPNGQTDASVCDIGTSRWFNYYLCDNVLCCCCPKHLADTAHAGRREGAFWSVSQAPHMDGIYCKSLLTV